MVPRIIAPGEAVRVEFIVPAGFIVLTLLRIKTAKQPLVEIIIFPHDHAGVGVVTHVLMLYPIVFDKIADRAEQETGKALASAAKAQGDRQYGAHWAGQGVSLIRELPAAELIRTLVRESGF